MATLSTPSVLFDKLVKEDDISWKTMILESVKSKEMDPWDIDITAIAEQFVSMVRALKEMNFKISGKLILASAILLKLKSDKLVSEDINALDALIAATESQDEMSDIPDVGDIDGLAQATQLTLDDYSLLPRTPQPRKRKVSVYDLIQALEKALEVDQRRMKRITSTAPQVHVPKRQFDINVSITQIHAAISDHYDKNNGSLSFTQLIPAHGRFEKLYTFIPLLHLRNMHKIDLHQADHFSDFAIELLNKTPPVVDNKKSVTF